MTFENNPTKPRLSHYVCRKCKENKPRSEYDKHNGVPIAKCKPCERVAKTVRDKKLAKKRALKYW